MILNEKWNKKGGKYTKTKNFSLQNFFTPLK
jgi:hypothetical protein